jgi:hypothetical protein
LCRICTSAFVPGGQFPVRSKRLAETKDAVDTRLAVYGRLCLSERTRSGATCVGIPAAQSRVQARLPHGHAPGGKWTHRRIRLAVGLTVSLSTHSCAQTLRRRSGCRSLIQLPFFSRRRLRDSPPSAISVRSRRYSGAVQTKANIGLSEAPNAVCRYCSSTIRPGQRRWPPSFRSTKHFPSVPMQRCACGGS